MSQTQITNIETYDDLLDQAISKGMFELAEQYRTLRDSWLHCEVCE
jgi:hypothetical protein